MKLGTETNSNMLSLMMAFICPVLDWKCSLEMLKSVVMFICPSLDGKFGGTFGQENQNCLFKIKFGKEKSIVNLLCQFWTENKLFGQVWLKKLKQPV